MYVEPNEKCDSYVHTFCGRILRDNAPINSKVQHPPPGQPPGHLNFLRLACSNSLPSGQKSRSNAPPISTELPLLKDKFRLQSNTLTPFRERYAE